MPWLIRSRRALWITTAFLIAAVIAGAGAWWFLWVPNVRPSLRVGELFGVDVSNHQGEIDWDALGPRVGNP